MIQHNSPTRRHGGFTLIELLVVLAIIAVLVSLSAVALLGFLGTQSLTNTKLLLQKTDNGVQQQWTEVINQAKKEPPPQSVLRLAGGDANRAQTIWIKLRLKQEFPMSYAEALNPGGGVIPELGPLPSYVQLLNGRTAANNPNTEMGACLLMSLSRPRTGKKFNPEEALGASAIKDTDGDGIPEIVDGWGNAVGFCRWGTGNTALLGLYQGRSGTNLDNDTQDPLMTLMAPAWNNSSNPAVARFQSLCHVITKNGGPYSYYTKPVIVSAGKDGIMGLNLPPVNSYPWDMSLLAPGSADNVYSFQVN